MDEVGSGGGQRVAGPGELARLVDGGDDAELLAAVDRFSAARAWDDLVDLAARCTDAVEMGRQLWALAAHIEYRLALEAPPAYAGPVVHVGAGRHTLGPLSEVAAGQHSWAALAGHLTDPASRSAFAQERVLRGEDLSAADVGPADLPGTLAAWEPAYPLPVYRAKEALFAAPDLPRPHEQAALPAPRRPAGSDAATRALHEVVRTWADTSAGTVTVAGVHGDALEAVGALTAARTATAAPAGTTDPAAAGVVRLAPLEPGEALAWLQWAGSSGGAYGRRRGGAAGRFAAWWAAAALAGLDWPAEPAGPRWAGFVDTLGEALDELSWWRWEAAPTHGTPAVGWEVRLVVADPLDGLAWALEATDSRGEAATAQDRV